MSPARGQQILRGQVWAIDVVGVGEKFFVVVSNNARNASAYPMVHVTRLTSRSKPQLRSIVHLDARDFGGGCVMCDEVQGIDKALLKRQVGVISPAGMRAVAEGIKHVFALA